MSSIKPPPGPWADRAKCRGLDVDMFMPPRGDTNRHAVAVCNACPVKAECLDYALTAPVERHGVWGGTSERERCQLRIAKVPDHGTRPRYNRGCRCDECRAANAAYRRERWSA